MTLKLASLVLTALVAVAGFPPLRSLKRKALPQQRRHALL